MVGKVSLYIPSYNSAIYLERCIEKVLEQIYPIEEIIVVDDGSADKTAEIVSKFPVKLIRHRYNRGIASVRNTAVMEAKGDFIAAVDADCLIEPTWLQRCMEDFIKPNIAAVGGRLLDENNEKIKYRWKAAHLKQHWGGKRKVNPIFLVGSNIIIRKEVFAKVGLYNAEKFKRNYEDVDFSLRLKKKDLDLIYNPDAVARHIKKDTIGSILKTYWSWHFYDYKPKYISRLIFNFINCLKLILEDIKSKKFEFIFIGILTFPCSAYFDFKKLLKDRL
ncbi:MAG: glycosyltransferase [Candidatus Omnitrophota bacterium]|nr:MAG: glycosyltransferase [Candidatus Omnitrophota bacterium]